VGPLRDCTWILGLPDYRVVGMVRQGDGRLIIELERRGLRRYVCLGCGRRTGRIRDAKARTWDDVPWAEHPVTLRYPLRRLWCRQCGIRTERVGFADPRARLTRRFRQRIGLDRLTVWRSPRLPFLARRLQQASGELLSRRRTLISAAAAVYKACKTSPLVSIDRPPQRSGLSREARATTSRLSTWPCASGGSPAAAPCQTGHRSTLSFARASPAAAALD
jgi:hypothetical protein